ncbi:MAG: ABC transporter permease [Candidatus Hodarchaeales archaeon]
MKQQYHGIGFVTEKMFDLENYRNVKRKIQQNESFRRIIKKSLEISSKPLFSRVWYFFVVLFFIGLVLLPTVFVLSYVLLEFGLIQSEVLSNSIVQSQILESLFYSISVSIIVTIIDLIFGLPIAWVLVRREFKFKTVLNSIIELPLAVPTAGLGFSVALFWGVTPAVEKPLFAMGFVKSALPILVLFHFTTTFPYVVRSLAAILESIDETLEVAARTCGANKFTAARTVTLPLFRSGLATAMVLSLAKSLSDTGGVVTVLATIQSVKTTGTVLISNWKHEYKDAISQGIEPPAYLLPSMAFMSGIMIVIALLLVFFAKSIAKNVPMGSTWRVFPRFERLMGTKNSSKIRDFLSFGFLLIFVIVPSFFLVLYLLNGSSSVLGLDDWILFIQSVTLSVIVASIATLVNIVIGVPIAVLITRKAGRITSRILDSLVDIPYIVPSAALGFSVGLFWTTQTLFQANEIIFVILAHISMPFPFIVRNTIGGLSELDQAYEDAARTLGARPVQTFKNVTLPVIKFSIIAGAIMSFTRSIGETGATLAVSPDSITAPVFIVTLIKEGNYFFAALTTIFLILISSVLIFVLRLFTAKKKRK